MSTPFDEFMREERRRKAEIVARSRVGQSPADAAKANGIAARHGVTPDIAASAIPRFDEQDAANEVGDAVTRSGTVGSWLFDNPSRVAVARGSFKQLTDTDQKFQNYSASTTAGKSWMDRAKAWSQGLSALGDAGTESGMDSSFSLVTKALGALLGLPEAYQAGDLAPGKLAKSGAAGVIGLGSSAAGIGRTLDGAAARANPAYQLGTLGLANVATAIYRGASGDSNAEVPTISGGLAKSAQALDAAALDIRPVAQTTTGAGIQSGIESLPTMVAALSGGWIAGSARAAALIGGGATYGTSFNKGMEEGLGFEGSAKYGLIDAGIEYGTEVGPFSKLLGNVGSGKGFGRKLLEAVASDLPGEQFATLGQDFNQWLFIDANKGKTFDDFLAERPEAAQQTFWASLVGSGTITTALSATEFAAAKMGREIPGVLEAEGNKHFLDKLLEDAKNSEVLKRDPASFQAFVASLGEENGVTDVFIDAEKALEVFDQSGLTPEEVETITGQTVEALTEAAHRGEDLSFPIEHFAAIVSQSPAAEALTAHLRTAADEPSFEQAQKYMQGVKEELAKEAELALAQGLDADARAASRAVVEDAIVQKIMSTGRYSRKDAQKNAALTAALYDRIGARLGVTAEQAMRATELGVSSGESLAPSFTQEDTTVNIGLDVFDELGGGEVTPEEITAALAEIGVEVKSQEVHQSDTERTFVGTLSRPLTPEEGAAISEKLRQEAIAQNGPEGGALFGPKAADWGPFNPEFFIAPGGERLSSLNQSAAALQTTPLIVVGTAPGGRVRNADLARVLTERHDLAYGRTLDPTQPEDYDVVLKAMVEDYTEQTAQADNGEAWYSDDIATAIETTTAIIPDLADPKNRDLFLTITALLSPQQAPALNWENAVIAMQGFLETGTIPVVKPNGKQFGVSSHTTGLQLLQHLINTHGLEGALLWVRTPQTGRAMAETRRDSGLFTAKDKLGGYLPKETNLNEEKLGIYMMGPKVGDFMQNSVGIDQNAVTVDLWLVRTYSRLTGRLLDVSPGAAEAGDIVQEVRGRAERDTIKRLVRDAAEQAGIQPSAMQAALWYFEQRLYRSHGIKADSQNFSDAARKAARVRGIETVERSDAQGRTGVGEGLAATDTQASVWTLDQAADPLSAFRRESFYPTRAARLEDGTVVVAGVPSYYPDRLAKIAADLGAKSVEAVADNDNRLEQGVPLWFTRPPVEADGTIRLEHFSSQAITQTDPNKWGTTDFIPAAERARIGKALPRTYFGIASGQPGGYKIEFGPGATQYQAAIPAERLYDVAADPAGLKGTDGLDALERRIHAAGYAGYWTNNEALGLVATVFEPLPVKAATAYKQDAVFFSALERAVERSTQAKATGQQWAATLKKTPGVKQEELEWTGLLDFLADAEGQITRDAILELVRGGGIQIDEVVLGRSQEDVLNDYGYTLEDLEDPEHEASFIVEDSSVTTQFSNWSSDPSNPTYREVLITLPMGERGNPGRAPSTHWDTEAVVAHARFMEKQDAEGNTVLHIEEVQSDWHQKGRDQGYETKVDPAVVAAAQAKYDAAVAAYEARQTASRAAAEAALPAVLARVAQAGNDPEINPIIMHPRALLGLYRNARNIDPVAGEAELPEIQALTDAILAENDKNGEVSLYGRELDVAKGLITNGGVPNAPFKTTWPALVMKRMIRWAAEHGYQKITWTTGAQQAARYNLSSATGDLIVRQGSISGDYFVQMDASAAGKLYENGLGEQTNDYGSGRMTLRMTEAQVKEAFGNDVAKKIAESSAAYDSTERDAAVSAWQEVDQQYVELRRAAVAARDKTLLAELQEDPDLEAIRDADLQSDRTFREAHRRSQELREKLDAMPNGVTLSGDDLTVGGEGMKAFYDRNLVNITNDLVKKYGTRVGMVAIVNEAEQRLAEQNALYSTAPVDTSRAQDMQPGFEITPELAEAAMGGFPLFQRDKAPRGQIAFPADISKAPSVISILRGADLSTYIHELGHFAFEVMNYHASQAGAPTELIADRDEMLRFIGVESATEWEQRTPEARREGHEKLARAFEAYMWEGKAPSLRLRNLFSSLRQWMRDVYRSLTRLNVELTPEVRGVFDRMLASEEEIREAEAATETRNQFTERPEGVTDGEWAAYQSLGNDATEEASHQLEARSLRDMRYSSRAMGKEIKRLQAEVADRRAVMREEVEAELAALPVYRAINFTRRGVLDGEKTDTPHRMSSEEVRLALALDDAPMPDALKGMTTTKDPLHPQQVAELFGYTSADHLLKDLLFASPFKDAVEAETDSRMRERYGEMNSPEALEDAARHAVHNEVRGRMVATEAAWAQKAPGKARVLSGAARRVAADMIARLRIRDLRPGQFEAAERRAAKAMREAGSQNEDEFVRQSRNRLLHFYAAKAAHDAVEETQKARDYLTKFENKNTRKAIDPDYLDQIDQVLEAFELRAVSNKEADRRKTLAEWVAQQEALGFTPVFDDEMMAQIGRKPWRDLTVEEMRDLLDGIKNIEHLGRTAKKLLTAIDKANLEDAAAQMVETIQANAFKDVPEIIGPKTWWERTRSGFKDFFAHHRKFANLVYVMDGNRAGGVVWERLVRGMNNAGDRETTMNREAGAALDVMFKALGKTDKREFIPEIGNSLSLEGRLMVALNWGNSLNRQRILDGDKWTPEQVDAILAPLTAEHWDFVEGMWSYINTYWDQIAAKERRVSGIVPAKVEAEPFQVPMPDGSLRLISGGYFPLKYDPDRSSKAEAHAAADVAKSMMMGAFTRATTRRGFTKKRAETVNRPLRKDFGVIFSHVSEVIHDLTHHEWLIDANRLVGHKGVDAAIRQHYGPETLRWMKKALEDIASGDLGAQNDAERALNYIRTGATIAGLGWNLWTSLLQPIGLTQSWSRIGGKWVGRGIAELLGSPLEMNDKVKWVYEVSPFMRARGDTMQREINEIRNKLSPKSPIRKSVDKVVGEAIGDAVAGSYFTLIGKAQLLADLPTWLGQYHKSLDAGESADRAALIADQAVIDSQSSGMIKDLSGIQRGSPIWKLWTNFYSYFNGTLNQMSDRTAQLRRVGVKDLPYYAVDVALLTFVPATLTSLLYQITHPDDDDEWEDVGKKVAADNLNYMLGLMVGLREVGSAALGRAGYSGPAGARVFGEIGRLSKQVEQGEADEALTRATNSVAGVLFHYPAGQVDRTVRGLIATANGEAGPQAAVFGPPRK